MRFPCVYGPAKAEGVPPTAVTEIRRLYQQHAN